MDLICEASAVAARALRLSVQALSYLVFACAACACASALAVPNAADVTRPQSHLNGVSTLSDLQQGRELYQARCGSCHALRDPMSLQPESWAAQVRDMRDKKGVRLSATEARQITAYLTAISSR
ncbi:MAG: cytochrome c [Pseudomonadota bacterium]